VHPPRTAAPSRKRCERAPPTTTICSVVRIRGYSQHWRFGGNPCTPWVLASHRFALFVGVSHPPADQMRTKPDCQGLRVASSKRPSCSQDRCLLSIYVSMLSLTPDSYHRSKHRGSTQLAPEFATSEYSDRCGASASLGDSVNSPTHQRAARFAVLQRSVQFRVVSWTKCRPRSRVLDRTQYRICVIRLPRRSCRWRLG
jgi:hypothetical protein